MSLLFSLVQTQTPDTTMAFSLKYCVIIFCVGLMVIALCRATLRSITTEFTEGKKLSTSYKTLPRVSKIKCVETCNKEKQTGGCTLAGYNKATRSCYPSLDGPQDVLDTEDEAYGVFFYEPDQTGNNQIFMAVLKWPIMIDDDKVYSQQMKVDLQRIIYWFY